MTPVAQADSKAGAWRGQSVTEMTPEQNEAFEWQIVNDGVMGGLSKGKVEFTGDGTMAFSGILSLENNGGFSMVRTEAVDFNLSNDLGLLLRVRGDGRAYEVRLESDARYRNMPVSFSGKFQTTKGKWEQVKVPFSSFKGGFRGRDLPDTVLDPALIKRIGFLLADKREGAFGLEIDWIRTYGQGQGKFTEGRSEAATATTVAAVASAKPRNLIDTAVADGRFSTFIKALDAAGLTVFFQWDNPLTVFAPTDEAFAKLPRETLEEILKPKNKQKLVAILSCHVSPGSHLMADALSAKSVDPVKGKPLSISFTESKIRVNDAALIEADVKCSDGVIHVIDTVLLPPELEKIAGAADS